MKRLGWERRARELASALSEEFGASASPDLTDKLSRVYEELGVVLPGLVVRRFNEVGGVPSLRSFATGRRFYRAS